MDLFIQYLPHLLLAWSIQWVGILSPGPGVALILSTAINHGRMPAVTTVFGIACGAMVLAATTIIGVVAIFSQVSELMFVIRLVGASYLIYFAYKSFRNAVTLPPLNLSSNVQKTKAKTALAGFVMQVTNPKAIFFWLAIAAADGIGGAPTHIAILFIIGAFVNSFIGHGAYAVLLSSDYFRQTYLRARRWIEGSIGVFFTLFALRLATERN